MFWSRTAVALGLLLAQFSSGCHHPQPPSTTALNGPNAAMRFSDAQTGIAFTYPAGWEAREDRDYRLLLVPAGASAPVGAADAPSITLDVPDLPIHLPGMVQMGAVRNGFLDDLRKQVGSVQVVEDSVQQIPSAHARLVRSTWNTGGRRCAQSALLMIHADRVYIIRCTSDDPSAALSDAAFRQIVQSLQWL